MSNKVIIDLTQCLCNEGKKIEFCGNFLPEDSLLSYPQSKFVSVDYVLNVVFTNPNVEADGNLIVEVSGLCDKCAKQITKKFDFPFEICFCKDQTSDPDMFVYSGSKLDVTEAFNQEIVLNLPTSFLCKEDCKGLCPKCGADRNVCDCGCDTTKENPFSFLKNLKF